jgi:hypothetical protein
MMRNEEDGLIEAVRILADRLGEEKQERRDLMRRHKEKYAEIEQQEQTIEYMKQELREMFGLKRDRAVMIEDLDHYEAQRRYARDNIGSALERLGKRDPEGVRNLLQATLDNLDTPPGADRDPEAEPGETLEEE